MSRFVLGSGYCLVTITMFTAKIVFDFGLGLPSIRHLGPYSNKDTKSKHTKQADHAYKTTAEVSIATRHRAHGIKPLSNHSS